MLSNHPLTFTIRPSVAQRKVDTLNAQANKQAGNGGHWWRYLVQPIEMTVGAQSYTVYTVERLHSRDDKQYMPCGLVAFEPWETGL